MRTFLIASLLMLAVPISANAQTTRVNCPEIKVLEPSSISHPGREMSFAAQVPGVGLDAKYEWSITSGTIVKGQGTLAIQIGELKPNTTIHATIRVVGVPPGCPDSSSGSGGVAPEVPLESLDEWGRTSRNVERGRLDSLFNEVLSNPGFKAVLVLKDVPENKRNRNHPKIKFVLKHAKFRGFDPRLLVFVFETERVGFQSVKVYRIRTDAAFPCSGCISINGSEMI